MSFIIGLNFSQVRAGEWNIQSRDEAITHQDLQVEDIMVHPEFHSGSLKNDIALLFLTQGVILTENVGLICLPQQDNQLTDTICTASGWGKDALKQGRHSAVLKKVDLPLVGSEMCLAALRKTRLGIFYNLHESFICAGGEPNKDTCKGDGGSPLVCPIPGQKGRFFQIGIVSWGIGCGESETPGVYVNVALYKFWIDQQMTNKKLDIDQYRY